MVQSLILQFLVFPVVSFVFYYTLFSLRPPFPTLQFGAGGALWAALVAAFFTWLALNKWHGIRHIAKDLALEKETGFRDGKRAVVSGYIRKTGPLLSAPCSGEPCVAYRYEASHHHTYVHRHGGTMKSQSRWLADYKGYAMSPAEVKGSMKSAAILAEPDCIQYPAGGPEDPELTGDDVRERLQAYLENADHGEEANDRLEGRAALTKVTNPEPGNFRVDTRAEEADELSGIHTFQEWLLKDGDLVLIAGIYYAERNGIGPGPNSTTQPLQITPGGKAMLEAQAAGYGSTIRNGLVLSILTGFVYFSILVF